MIILDKERFDVETIVADSNFVKVMKFPVRYGNIASLNDNPQNVIITQILANKLLVTGILSERKLLIQQVIR